MHNGDRLEFKRLYGCVMAIGIVDTQAEIVSTTLKTPGEEVSVAMTVYRF